MRFREITNRLPGLSTPIFDDWEPPEADLVVAQRVLTFLEDRRVLYNPMAVEIAEHCVTSVLEIRQYLTRELGELHGRDDLSPHLQAMRAACRKFLDNSGCLVGSDFVGFGFDNVILNQALGELRGVFGIHIAQIAVKYGLDVDNQLAAVLPAAPD